MARITALDGWRGLLSVNIFCYHWFFGQVDAYALPVRIWISQGYRAVTVFFVLSGFLFAARYVQRFEEGSIHYERYVLERVLRLWPLYAIVLTLFLMILGRPEGMMPKTLLAAISAYSMTQALVPEWTLIGLTTAWTLTVEMSFVLIAPLIARMLAGISTLQACARLVLLGALAFPLATVITPFGWSHEHVLHYTLFGRLPDFLAGMCAALVMRHRTAATIARHAWLSVFVLAGLASLSYLWNTHDETPLGRLQGIGYAAVSAWLIVGFAHPQGLLRQLGQLLSSAPLRWLGTLSFALYLIHLTEPVQYFYWIMIPPLTGDSAPLRVLLTLVFSLAVSMLLHGLIERPLNRIVSRWRRA